MAEPTHVHPADLHGLGQLAIAATLGMTDLVEAMHQTIASAPSLLGPPTNAPADGIAGLVYRSIRDVTRIVGGSLNATLMPLTTLLGERHSSAEREAMLAVLNGVVGDHLADSANPLATTMQLRYAGRPLELTRPALAAAIPQASGKIVLLAHGLCLNERHWLRNGHDHGARLAADLGYTPVYLRYNTGLHISANGRALADMIEALLQAWPAPVEQLAIVAHSMGGLVSRSACYYGAQAGQAWPGRLRALALLGSPHHGAPLERGGNWVNVLLEASPYTGAFARLGKIRSAGITDLRYGNLLDDDWVGQDRFVHTSDHRRPVALPAGARCFAVGATIGRARGDLHDQLLGDGLVPLESALGHHANPLRAVPFPADHQWVGVDMNHLDLLDRVGFLPP